jgi:ribosomal protein RSM22 (predicted rRNA methylase)
MAHTVSPYLRSKIDDIVSNIGGQPDLAGASSDVSRKYRRLDGKNLQISSKSEAIAYLLTRFPATYAAACDALSRVKDVMPDFMPRNILDIGAGPATATLAARSVFEGDVSAQLIEINIYLRELGQELLGDATAVYHSQSIQSYKAAPKYNLVLASYVLNELPEADAIAMIQKYWERCDGVMVILEPGTPQGAKLIGLIRHYMTTLPDAHIIGPCPQAGVCPLQDFEKRWCHFSVRVERSRRHKHLKGGEAGYEDEKFSWLAVSRKPAENMSSYRVIGHPTGTGVRQLQVCGKDGKAENLNIAKSHPQYKKARKAEWGDAF